MNPNDVLENIVKTQKKLKKKIRFNSLITNIKFALVGYLVYELCKKMDELELEIIKH